MCRFWRNPDGLAAKQLEKKVLSVGPTGQLSQLEVQAMYSGHVVHLHSGASLDELLVEASRFFVLKAICCDIAAAKLHAAGGDGARLPGKLINQLCMNLTD
ncbi:unnamed protein product [Cladocopium goreaui]|uniref:Uncharacterized protein n=1 Tax=Cladocopium goreaui TaxID=2562237 RepID=A0A9P1BS70_9DINO|nr:unnamed protein product [Cladocopium goreaui]